MVHFIDVVRVLAVLTGFTQTLGPLPDTIRIAKTRSTGVTPIVPLVTMFACGWVWTTYGILHSDIFPLATTNGLNVLFAMGYISVYYRYTPERPYVRKVFAAFGLAVVLVTLYAVLGYKGYTHQSRGSVTDVMGYIGNVIVFVLFVAPFEKVAEVFRHRSGAFIPIYIVLANVLNATTWLTYGLMIADWLIIVPNIGSLVIGGLQMAVYFYFHPSTHPLPMELMEESLIPVDVITSESGKGYKAVDSPAATSHA